MDCHDIVVIGASLGGVETLPRLLKQLPADFPASIFIVQHTASGGPGLLAGILDRACAMKVQMAEDNQPIEKSRVYVAPPDRHMLIEHGTICVVKGPTENGSRPAIDPLFRSAAVSYGPRVVGVVLTGALDDGSAGLLAVKRCNGVVMVQEPGDAFCDEMPSSALALAEPVDYQLGIAEMGPILQQLSKRQAREAVPIPKDIQLEVRMAQRMATVNEEESLGTLVPLVCPECGGTLWEHGDSKMQRFRCHVGHAFTALSLLARQNDEVEKSLWMTLRSLEEREELLQRMTEGALQRGFEKSATWYSDQTVEVQQTAEKVRGLLYAEG